MPAIDNVIRTFAELHQLVHQPPLQKNVAILLVRVRRRRGHGLQRGLQVLQESEHIQVMRGLFHSGQTVAEQIEIRQQINWRSRGNRADFDLAVVQQERENLLKGAYQVR